MEAPAPEPPASVRRVSRRGPRTRRTARRRKSRSGRFARLLRFGKKLLFAALVLFTLAAVAGAYLSIFCFHYYTVASNSMSPTLIGQSDLRDRVLCWLRAFPGRDPRRWEIVIFHTPDTENLDLLAAGETLSLRHGMTIKRVIGLAGEEISLRDGDAWARSGAGGAFQRQVKPAEVQDKMWIPVYEAAFPAVSAGEFAHYWRSRNDAAVNAADAADGMFLTAGAEFSFRPLVRAGRFGREIRELAGIPDRYLLPQDLTFLCADCGERFTRRFAGGQAQERCPACGVTAYEEDVLVYSHDSGLTTVGPDAVTGLLAGDSQRYRVYPYHIVGDLRVAVEVLFAYPQSALSLRLEKNGVVDTVVLSAQSRPEIAVGEWVSAAFARVDGELRLVLDGKAARSAATASLSAPAGGGSGASSEDSSDGFSADDGSSGVSLAVDSGGVLLRRLSVGRDAHYFGGAGNPFMPQFSAMSPEDGISIPHGEFFTLGDNTDVSLDSRAWGGVPYALLAGTAVWWNEKRLFGEEEREKGEIE